jgi:serine/threonine protein kinase
LPNAPNTLYIGGTVTILPGTVVDNVTGFDRPLLFWIKGESLNTGEITYALEFESDRDPGGMYLDARSGEVIAKPHKLGTFRATLVAKYKDRDTESAVAAIVGAEMGVNVWSWAFTVRAEDSLKLVPGSLQRETFANSAGAADSGNSIVGLHNMYLDGTPFHLGAITNISFTGFKEERDAAWKFTMDGAPPHFLISPTTAEVQGNPTVVTATPAKIRILAQDRSGREAVVEEFELRVHVTDTSVPTNGPNGMACDSKGTLRISDGEPFDSNFTCTCMPRSQGQNCELTVVTHDFSKSSRASTGIAGGLGTMMLVITLIATTAHVRRSRRKMAPADFSDMEHEHRPREIKRGNLTLLHRVGAGAYGEVWKASLRDGDGSHAHDIIAAVKLVKVREVVKSNISGGSKEESRDTKDSQRASARASVAQKLRLHQATADLIDEARLMAKVGYHPNILSIVGVSTCGYPKMLIVSYCEHGSLLRVLKKAVLVGAPIATRGKLEFALGVVEGMAHLMENRVVHRDLAARNVLLTSGNSSTGMEPRVADFGLSRMAKVEGTSGDYYRSTKGVFPVRWTSPDAMESLKFTEASDVWSFGILLVEILQDGGRPYPDILSNTQVYTMVIAGSRHPQPPGCSDGLFAVMMQCWGLDVEKRPSFNKLVATFSELAGRKSVADIALNNFPHKRVPDSVNDPYQFADSLGFQDLSCTSGSRTYEYADSAVDSVTNAAMMNAAADPYQFEDSASFVTRPSPLSNYGHYQAPSTTFDSAIDVAAGDSRCDTLPMSLAGAPTSSELEGGTLIRHLLSI